MNEVSITGDLNKSFDWLSVHGKGYFVRALVQAANIIKTQAKANLSSNLPAAGNHNPRYNDTLLDAIRNTHTEGDEITIHTLGTRNSGSGTYRTRFFENELKSGTRYQKTYKGIPLKKKRYLGRLKPLKFFSSAVSSVGERAIQSMQTVIDDLIDDAQKQQS